MLIGENFLGKLLYLFDKRNRGSDRDESFSKDLDSGDVFDFAMDDPQASVERGHSLEWIEVVLFCNGSDSSEKAESLNSFASLSSDEVLCNVKILSAVPDFLRHKDSSVRMAARAAVLAHSEQVANIRPDVTLVWRKMVEDLLSHDRRTNRFVHAYPQTLAVLECLSAVGKWTIHEDKDELARFFLYLELESHIATGRKDFSNLATDFIDFCGYTYFVDFYPNAIDYMLQLLEGECLPQWEKPYHKVFERLCKFRQHDRITQILLSAVVGGDLGRVDWFTRNLYPNLFESYLEYERALIELMSSAAMPQEIRENALTAMLFISEDFLSRRIYFSDFVRVVRESFDQDTLRMLLLSDSHPKILRMVTSSVRLVR